MLRLLKKNSGVAIVLAVLLLMAGAFWLVLFLTKLECDNYGQATGMETKHYLIGGCYAKTFSNGWMKTSNIIHVNDKTQ